MRIWHRKMYHAHNERLEKRKNGGDRTIKPGKNKFPSKEGKLQELRSIGNGHHQTSGYK